MKVLDVMNQMRYAQLARASKKRVSFSERIKRTIILCLRHRCRRDPMESINSGDKVKSVFEQVFLGVEI